MSYDEMKLNYGLAEDMIRTLEQAYEQLQDTMQEMQSIANILEEGALLGNGGSALTDVIRINWCPSLSRLMDRLNEMTQDIQKTIAFMQEADAGSRDMFSG